MPRKIMSMPLKESRNNRTNWLNWIARNTPAITIVLECSNAEIGVGAAIALRSHDVNGSWADLLMNIHNNAIENNEHEDIKGP